MDANGVSDNLERITTTIKKKTKRDDLECFYFTGNSISKTGVGKLLDDSISLKCK